MNIQSLFHEPIESQISLGGHASDVWLVKTSIEEVVVRTSGVKEDSDAPFIYGCKNLFGTELNKTFDIDLINLELSKVSLIQIPQVIRKQIINGSEFIVVTKMNGKHCSFSNIKPEVLENFGRDLAIIHKRTFTEFGNIKGTYRNPISQFNKSLARVLTEIRDRYYKQSEEDPKFHNEIINNLSAMPAPSLSSYVMIDMDSRQLLFDDHRVTAIVDTEAYVIGPRELDLVTIECNLDSVGARAFKRGYESISHFPDLKHVRKPYRYFFSLLEVQGPIDYKEWINTPEHFDCNSS